MIPHAIHGHADILITRIFNGLQSKSPEIGTGADGTANGTYIAGRETSPARLGAPDANVKLS